MTNDNLEKNLTRAPEYSRVSQILAELSFDQLQSTFPLLVRQLLGPIYILPAYRQSDYADQRAALAATFDHLSQRRSAQKEVSIDETEGSKLSECLLVLGLMHWLSTGKRTLFLERELAEAFMRTDLLSDLSAEDVRWKYRSFRLYVPLDLIKTAPDVDFSVAQIDVSHLNSETLRNLILPPLDPGISDFYARLLAMQGDKRDLMVVGLRAVTPQEESIEQPIVIDHAHHRLGEIAAGKADYISTYRTESISAALHLALNVLLFLGAQPLEYEPGALLRKAKAIGDRVRPELRNAVFVGRLGYRPCSRPAELVPGQGETHLPGRKLSAHWRAGHWKRVVYEAGRSERRLSWIQPYQTHGQVDSFKEAVTDPITCDDSTPMQRSPKS